VCSVAEGRILVCSCSVAELLRPLHLLLHLLLRPLHLLLHRFLQPLHRMMLSLSQRLTFSMTFLLGLCCGQELTGVARWWGGFS
jgi:hypothetical protein